MRQYKEISLTNYYIQQLICKCNTCDFEFDEYTSLNYELVCFIDELGEKFFMPTYGEYGYLDLLEKIVEDWKPNERITRKVVKKFEEKLVNITPRPMTVFQKIQCPICSSDDIIIIKRTTLKNYPVNWVKIDMEKI